MVSYDIVVTNIGELARWCYMIQLVVTNIGKMVPYDTVVTNIGKMVLYDIYSSN